MGETAYERIFRNNREWVERTTREDPTFFERRLDKQEPTFLFIGCSDSRVTAELLTGALPGEMFVHRNVANLAVHTDLNFLTVLQYAVDVLRVPDILVCGHYGCGGVKAAMDEPQGRLVDHWLRNIRDVMRLHESALDALPDDEARYRRLVELNAAEQAYNLRRSPVVEAAWARGQPLAVHAMVYDIKDGLLRDLELSADERGDLLPTRVTDGPAGRRPAETRQVGEPAPRRPREAAEGASAD
jgi:carbonic anhydrase